MTHRYNKQITITMETQEMQARIDQLEQTLIAEREEFKSFYRAHKDTVQQLSLLADDNAYVDEDYYKESQYIHSLKKQIDSLVQQNNALRAKNLKLIQELEALQ